MRKKEEKRRLIQEKERGLREYLARGGDFYDTLGVERNASAREIRHAYRQKVREAHPDRNPGVDPNLTSAMFRKVRGAYDVLGNEESRHQYDKERRPQRSRPRSPPPAQNIPKTHPKPPPPKKTTTSREKPKATPPPFFTSRTAPEPVFAKSVPKATHEPKPFSVDPPEIFEKNIPKRPVVEENLDRRVRARPVSPPFRTDPVSFHPGERKKDSPKRPKMSELLIKTKIRKLPTKEDFSDMLKGGSLEAQRGRLKRAETKESHGPLTLSSSFRMRKPKDRSRGNSFPAPDRAKALKVYPRQDLSQGERDKERKKVRRTELYVPTKFRRHFTSHDPDL